MAWFKIYKKCSCKKEWWVLISTAQSNYLYVSQGPDSDANETKMILILAITGN